MDRKIVAPLLGIGWSTSLRRCRFVAPSIRRIVLAVLVFSIASSSFATAKPGWTKVVLRKKGGGPVWK